MSTLKTIAIRHLNGSADSISLTSNGNVGIGNTNPGVRLVVDGRSTGTTPIVKITATSIGSEPFQWLSYAEAPLANGQNFVHIFGKSLSQYNSGYIGYKHAGNNLATNSVTLGMYASDNLLNVYGNGCVTKPYQPYFKIKPSWTDGTTYSDGTVLPFNVALTNNGGYYNTSTYRFTAPIAGLYWFDVAVLTTNNTAIADLRIYVNGSNPDHYGGYSGNWSGHKTGRMTHLVYLNSGDYVDARPAGTGSTQVNVSSMHSWFQGFLVC
jgi:C1q domain